ncbi:DUF421 domain-containing protein [Bacillus sp. SB49]|uniref:DUF421 domain-containing protein n=1 Tax=Bacillaceae TaxID=186817 RepID=UPI0002A512F3|nr:MULTISPECIES: DUF421 domain-containing protein [Bacillaceae]ELK44663.1 hypothetical protein D479_18059 [Halobacillus sp. BAB-2008]QHT47002.1 DUF421 domain-containing protein [Bacillus sp. SB49]
MVLVDFLLRGFIMFALLYILARILSKKLISQLTLFDFIAGITLGSMTSNTFLTPDLPLWHGIAALVLFSALVMIMDIWTIKSFRVRKWLNSEPTLLIDNGKILEEGMAKVRFTVDELIGELRKSGVFHFRDVQVAVLETDGTVSVLRKSQYTPLTQGDIGMKGNEQSFPQVVIIQGNLLPNSLAATGYSEEWIEDKIAERGISDWAEIVTAQLDTEGNLYIDRSEDSLGLTRKDM